MQKKYVLITTDKDKRGIFAGFLEQDNSPDFVVLSNARMVVYFPKENRGVVGLASIGPQSGARISYAIPEIKLFGVTSVMKCTEIAQKEFEKGKWN